MRYCVVYVEKVELFGARDGRHFCREGKVIWLVFEQRVRHHLDFVKMDPLV